MIKIILLGLTGVVVIIAAILLWANSGSKTSGYYLKQNFWSLPNLESRKQLMSGDEFTVMSWNIAFAHGDGSEGTNYKRKSQKEYQQSLELIAQTILKNKVDILFIQEIDFESDRTFGVNQAKQLSLKTLMPDTAPVESWKLRYLPFPGSPFETSKHFKKMSSGGAIMSRYRLENHEYYLLDKPSENSWFYNLFYLSRYIQSTEVFVVNRLSKIINLHLEAFGIKNREQQANQLVDIIKKEKPIIIAGDFNTFNIKGRSEVTFGDDNYEGDRSFEILDSNLPDNYSEALEDDSVFLETFPASNPNRRLDYIFYDKNRLRLIEADVPQGLSHLSDHLPVIAKFRVL